MVLIKSNWLIYSKLCLSVSNPPYFPPFSGGVTSISIFSIIKTKIYLLSFKFQQQCVSVRLTITGDLSLASLAAFRMCTKENRFETTSKKEEKNNK